MALRLCGSTPMSNSVLSLIQSLCQQICYNLNIRWPSSPWCITLSPNTLLFVSADSIPSDLAPAVIFLQVKTLWSLSFQKYFIARIWWRKLPAPSRWSLSWTVSMRLQVTLTGTPYLGFHQPYQITARHANFIPSKILTFMKLIAFRCLSHAQKMKATRQTPMIIVITTQSSVRGRLTPQPQS